MRVSTARECNTVGVDDPRDAGYGEAQVLRNTRQGDNDSRYIEEREECAEPKAERDEKRVSLHGAGPGVSPAMLERASALQPTPLQRQSAFFGSLNLASGAVSP